MSQSLIVAIILIVMIVSFFAGYIPMAATALAVPMFLQITGVLSFKDAWAGFSSSTVISLVVLFILGGILNQTTFLEDLKQFVVTKLGAGAKGKRRVLLAAMLMSVVFSTFASPVSAMAIMLPIVVAIAKDTGLPVKSTIKACTDVACSSNNVLPVGTALTAYITFNGYLEAAGATERFQFADPFLAKVPIFLVFFLYIYFIGFKHYAKSGDVKAPEAGESATKKADRKKAELTPFQNKLGKILFFGSAAAMIITSTFTSIDLYIVGGIAILIALAAGVINQKEAIRSIRWETIFIYGGTVSLSTAMNDSGLNEIIATGISSILGGVTNVYIVAGVFFLTSFIMTQFASNRTVGAVFRPLSIAAAVGLGMDPRFTLLAIHYGSSLSTLTPMATSAQLLAFNEGGFKMKEFVLGSIGPALIYFITFMVWFPICFSVL